jgi:hypothetical protein
MNSPRILLEYRPVRIGWLIEGRKVAQLQTAANWSTCLWGGCYNPMIPIDDEDLSSQLIAAFGVDVLIAVESSDATKAFVEKYPHLHLHLWREGLFADRRAEFVDIRHAARRAMVSGNLDSLAFLRPIWPERDSLSAIWSILVGRYPDPGEGIDYPREVRRHLEIEDMPMTRDDEMPAKIIGSVIPMSLTGYDIISRRRRFHSGWLNPGIVFGNAQDFDDLVLCWNLRAAGAEVWFYDQTQNDRMRRSAQRRLGQSQADSRAGVCDRLLHSSRRQPEILRRFAGRLLWGKRPALRRQSRHRLFRQAPGKAVCRLAKDPARDLPFCKPAGENDAVVGAKELLLQ